MLPRYLSEVVKKNFDHVLGMTDNRIAIGIRRGHIDTLILRAYAEGYKDGKEGQDRRI